MNLIFLFLFLIFSTSAYSDCAGQFTPLADHGSPFNRVHFFPKNGNMFLINGKQQKIPKGIGVLEGGVVGDVNKASIDKIPGKKLNSKTLYYVYVYMNANVMTMDFSKTSHKEDEIYGNQVHATDPSRSLIGMIYTNNNGLIDGNNRSQMTSSWCNRGTTALVAYLEGFSVSSKEIFIEPSKLQRLEWLQWGINNKFKQGFTVPNIHAQITVVNQQPETIVEITIGIDGTSQSTFISSAYQAKANTPSALTVTLTGANGTDEGYHFGTFLMRTPNGGKAFIKSGYFFSDPLPS